MNIKEIARRAGVSSATISRVLNNSGYVKEETRQKVLKAVEEYNYVPSAIARSLSIQDSLSVGTIIPDIENEFFSKVISGISEVAETYHYNIVFLGTNETLDKCRLPRYLTKPRQRRSEWDMAGSDGISRVSAVFRGKSLLTNKMRII